MGKQKSSGGGGGDDSKREQPLQAVLLADSFTRSFRPLSLDKSKVLCPLNNVTMMDYAIEFLAGAGVKELFVVCLRDEVEEHVQNNTWAKSLMQVTVVKDVSLTNAGDALRELDKRNMVQSDPFILMYGDTVTNVDIKPALAAHKIRHKKDSAAMMTLLMKEVGGWKSEPRTMYSSLRSAQDDLVIGFDPSSENRILVYEDRNLSKSSSVPCSFFTSHSQIDLHCDLLDCGIDICSPDVLARFSDEFDYRDIRREFVNNSVAEEEEGLQNKIFVHMLRDHEYAARVHDFATYAAVSQDLLQRWCYPVVPDNLPSGYERDYRYALQRHYVYREMKRGRTKIGRSAVLKGPTLIGSHCSIADDCVIEATVMGHNCKIGAKVTLQNCHLWDNVVVEEGATVDQSILAQDVVIRAGAKIGKGCLIGRGCIIGKDVVLPDFTRITLKEDNDGEEDDDEFDDFDDSSDEEDDPEEKAEAGDGVLESDYDVVGADGQGRVWTSAIDEDIDDDDSEEESPLEVINSQSMGFDRTDLYKERTDLQKEVFMDFDDAGTMNDDIDDYGMGQLTLDGDKGPSKVGEVTIGRQKGVDVVKELKIICLEHEDTAPIENLSIELNSFKFSQNATYSDCTIAATLAILEKMQIYPTMKAGKLVASLKSMLERWAPLLKKMGIGLDEEKSIVMGLETAALGGGGTGEALSTEPNFRFLLQTLHDEEIVSEEAILAWAADRRETDPESDLGKLFNQQPIQDFLEWLNEESSSDEDDSEEED
jgi:translation initiation factor eIF-2B subunit epsilon